MAKNILSLQLLRNSTLFNDYTAAVAGIRESGTNDGTIKLARYNESGTTKTIFGIYHAMETGGTGYTIYDADKVKVDGIISRLDALDGGGSGEGTVDQKISSAISALDYSGVTTGDGVVVTNVTETDGVVSATTANVGTLKLAGYDGATSGTVAATDTLNQALSKLQNQIDAANAASTAAIEALDGTITAETGYYINKVDEVDGKISGTTVALPTVAAISSEGQAITAVSQSLGTVAAQCGDIAAAHVTVADSGGLFTGANVEAVLAEIDAAYKAADAAIVDSASSSADTLSKLEDIVNELSRDAKEYSIVKVTTGLPETIKERYELHDADGNVSGDTIDIPKDSHIVSITYNGTTQKLTYNYIDASGNTQSTDVDMSELVLETEFGSGVTVTNHVAHGVVDTTSESFLTVDAGGFKLSGVQNAINEAVSSASEELEDVIETVSGNVDTLSAKTVTGVEMTGGTAAIDNNTDGTKKITINTDGSRVLATGYQKGSDASAIAATDSINAALAKLENQIDAAKAAATTKVVEGADAGNNLSIASATGSDNSVTYTINLTDVASDSALTEEIAHRKAVDGVNGDVYTADTNARYINNVSSLYDADQALDSAINTVSGKVDTISGNVATISGDVETLENRVDAISAVTSALTTGEIDAIEQAIGLNSDGTHIASTGNYTYGASTIEAEIVALDAQVKTNTDDIATLSGSSLTGVTVNGSALTVTNNVASLTVEGKQSEATATDNEAIVVEYDENGKLILGLANLDAGTY